MDEVTRKLHEMLAGGEDSEVAAGEAGATAEQVREVLADRYGFEPSDEAVAMVTSALQTGRGPTGRLRNFKAMSDAKFYDAAATIRSENNDAEAIEAVNAEQERREVR